MKRMTLALFLITLTAGWAAADPAAQAVGYWKSISDVKGEAGKVTAVWQLSLDSQGLLQGTVVWVPGKGANEKYDCKKPEFNGKPVQGTFWMKGLKKNGSDSWAGGTIVDIGGPAGDVYGCEIKVNDNGKKLEMRGYLGIALFGRTQTWEQISPEDFKILSGK